MIDLKCHTKEFKGIAKSMIGRPTTLRKKIETVQKACRQNSFAEFEKVLRGAGKQDQQLFRKIHDFFGWMAKQAKTNKRGGCSGMLYRSAGFMQIPKADRNGTREGPNIHSEHVIPNRVLKGYLWDLACKRNKAGKPLSLEEAFMAVLAHSVCAAVTPCESRRIDSERTIESKTAKWRARHPGFRFDGDAAVLEDERPFLRYVDSGVKIYSMASGRPINFKTYTYADHWKALKDYPLFCFASYPPA